MFTKVLFVLLIINYGKGAVNIPNIKLNDGNEMPAIAFGTWLGLDDKGLVKPQTNETEQSVIWALEAGYNHIDTAYLYAIEDQVGRALKKVPKDKVFVTTKLWNDRHGKDEVVPALRESLRLLQLDYVDLYLIHWPVALKKDNTFDTTDYLETWKGMIEAKKLGLTKSIGVSNFNQEQLDRILNSGLEKPVVNQVELNINLQQPKLREYLKSHDIDVMGYTPFGSLFYSKAKPGAPAPRVDDPVLVKIAEKYKKTVSQVVLRYLVEIGVVPLPKSLTKGRIEKNIDIFDFQLTEDERATLKSFDKECRTIPVTEWLDHPYYPFHKPTRFNRSV